MSYKLSNDDALRISDVMVKLCELELASSNDLREKAGYKKKDSKEEKKIYNCPNCGAPISSYICEYCGTEFEKPKKKMPDEDMRESFANFVRKQKLVDELKRQQRRTELQASQEWQTQNLLNALNIYGVNTQIMNMQDSINASMALQNCSLRDQMYNASMLTNVYPTGRIEHIPINKDENIEHTSVSEADEELAEALIFCMIGMVLFTLFAIVVTFIYNLR